MARGVAASEPPERENTSRPRSVARGRYDRAATPSERARMQRARLLEAVRIAGADGGELTVARLLAYVGCGRNTFYEHFDDTSGALSQACVESTALLQKLIGEALMVERPRTPSDAMGDVATAWAKWCELDERTHWALLERFAGDRIDEVLRLAVAHSHSLLVSVGAAAGAFASTRADASCGALRAIARGVHQRQPHGVTDAERSIADSSHDTLLRLLR